MSSAQKIYGRFEYPLGNTTTSELFDQYRENKIYRNDGVQIGGICVARNVNSNTAILMTYDEKSELMLRLKFFGDDRVSHHGFISVGSTI